MVDYIKSAFRNLNRKFTRTILTILGIAIGVASVIIISNISQCGSDTLNRELDSLGLSGLSVTASHTSQNATLDEGDLKLIKKLDSVEQAAPLMMENTQVSLRSNSLKALLWGIDTNAADIISLEVLYGHFFTKKEINSRKNVCLVDENLARTAYSRDNIIGKNITFLCGGINQEFTIVGIVKTGTGLLQNLIGDYIPTFIYVPYTTVQNFGGRNDYDEIAVKIKQGKNPDNVGENILSRLNTSNGTSDAFASNNLAKQKDGLTDILNIVTLILSAVGAISLLVASLSIMTVMLVSVNERTREIGIKKALGATRNAIMLEFIFEAVLISLIGCIVGIVSGYLISYAGAAWFNVLISLRPDIMLMASGFSLLSGTVFGVYPAYKAAKLKPVDALRQE